MRKTEQLTEVNTFETQELALATTLVCFGFPIFELRKISDRKLTFVFNRDSGMDDVIQGFWTDSISCSPKRYFYTLKEIKSRIFSERNRHVS